MNSSKQRCTTSSSYLKRRFIAFNNYLQLTSLASVPSARWRTLHYRFIPQTNDLLWSVLWGAGSQPPSVRLARIDTSCSLIPDRQIRWLFWAPCWPNSLIEISLSSLLSILVGYVKLVYTFEGNGSAKNNFGHYYFRTNVDADAPYVDASLLSKLEKLNVDLWTQIFYIFLRCQCQY